ncbi:cytochrome P450 94C1-like [Magnolia sinica]|uniref:cytochrome P450 94C1-like n=1 Tax=Magnolia sinica TaxID=86752 RepID=UPI00265B17DE|nr:cytochrome P450 94C1-like [Magnolia sinica]
MEFEASWWVISFSFLFFSFSITFFFFSLLLFLLRVWPWCNCDVCHRYLTSRWAAKFGNLCDWYTHLLHESPTHTIHIHILGNTITANPENVEYILKTRFDNYPKGKPFSMILGDLLGRGIFNVDGDHWRFQRKMASLELGSLSMRSYAFQIVSTEIQQRLLPLLASVADRDGCVLDLQDVFRRFAFDNICKISFGLDPQCLELSLPVSELAVAFDVATKLSAKRATLASPLIWKIKRLLNMGCERKLKEAIELVNGLSEEVIRQRRKMGVCDQHDLLSRFMCTVSDEKYLRDIVISFLLAGRDTVASALTCFFWALASNPDVEKKLREEIMHVLIHGEDVATFEQLKGMHYLHAALYESMRLYPPVQFDSKYALEDDVLPDGTFIKKGTRVTYHPYAMGRMEDIWGPDCLEFKPERWLNDGIFTPQNPFKYPVFQAGLRVCLGKEMAIVEMKSVAVALIQRFKIEMFDTCYQPKFAPGLTASLSGGLRVMVRNRHP